MSLKSSVEFKGTKEGIVLQLNHELEFEEVFNALKDKLTKTPGFFNGAEVIAIDGRTVTKREADVLEAILSKEGGMTVKSLGLYQKAPAKSAAKNTLKSDALSDKTVTNQEVTPVEPKAEVSTVFNGLKEGPTQFVRGTLRSGRSIVFNGNVVVLGDVNPGAEVIADGNIVVMGHLRGVAHAGAGGNHSAYVCANQLNPTQLRIGQLITRPPEESQGADPEIALVKGDSIVIEPYLA